MRGMAVRDGVLTSGTDPNAVRYRGNAARRRLPDRELRRNFRPTKAPDGPGGVVRRRRGAEAALKGDPVQFAAGDIAGGSAVDGADDRLAVFQVCRQRPGKRLETA